MKEDRAQSTEYKRQTINEFLCSRAEKLIKSGNDGISTALQLTDIVDNLLISAYESVTRDCNGLYIDYDLTLVAIGGYGRREIAPFSDIDIMLLAKKRDTGSTETAQSVLYRLWDMGLNISHCFRTLNECIEDAMDDFQTRTSLIESRFLVGSSTLFNEFRHDVYQKLLFKKRREFIGELLREIAVRHREYGDSLYLLEPNIKEGRGGLRDIHAVSWFLKTGLRINEMAGLSRILPEDDNRHFMKAYDFLLKVRACLHFISKRKNDILSFDAQEHVAKKLGFKDTKRFLSSEILMRLYYRKAKSIMDVRSRIANMCSRLYDSQRSRLYAEYASYAGAKKITGDFYLSRNEIAVKNRSVFKNTDKILEAFYIYSITGKQFSYQIKESIRSRLLFVNRRTRASGKAMMYFMEILNGSRVYDTLSEMHDTGVLDRFIPEFGRLRHLVIQEPHHRYTVDEHTLIAIKNLEMLKNTKQKKLQYLANIMKRYVKQEVLFLSVLLHDIGKGLNTSALYTIKHEDVGYRMIKDIMERFNIENDDRQRIEFLVKNHIVLSKLALTRDSDTPETVIQLAEIVENEENLNALYLMTYADMTAVNPHFWTEWKAYLFHDMYTKTKDHLRGFRGWYLDITDIKIKEFAKDMPDRYLVSNTMDTIHADYKMAAEREHKRPIISVAERHDGTAEFTIIADDMPGLFLRIVGAMGYMGLNILRARLYTSKRGLVIDRILVSNWRDIWWQGMEDQIKAELKRVIGQPTESTEHRAEGKITSMPYARGTLSSLKRFGSFVEIDNETAGEYTILEMVCPDRLGLLYDISAQFYIDGIDILSAVINTEDRIAQDVFYLQYRGGKFNTEIAVKVLNAAWGVIAK